MSSNLFIKRPDPVSAVRWFKNGDHPMDYSVDHHALRQGVVVIMTKEERKREGYEGDVVRYYRTHMLDGRKTCPQCGQTMHHHGWIDGPEGGHTVCPGDWIVSNGPGKYFPVKPMVFEKEYVAFGPVTGFVSLV